MVNNSDLVLKDIELCKRIAPIMERLGIEDDGYIANGQFYEPRQLDNLIDPKKIIFAGVPTYRQDKLALGLPNWFKEGLHEAGPTLDSDKALIYAWIKYLSKRKEEKITEWVIDFCCFDIKMLDNEEDEDIWNFYDCYWDQIPDDSQALIFSDCEATAQLLILLEDEGLGKNEKEKK